MHPVTAAPHIRFEMVLNREYTTLCKAPNCVARLLLWQDKAALPAIGAKEHAWDYYLRNWRPGMPHRSAWDGNYNQALLSCGGSRDPNQGVLNL